VQLRGKKQLRGGGAKSPTGSLLPPTVSHFPQAVNISALRGSPSVQRLSRSLEPTPVEQVREGARSAFPNRGQQGKGGEHRLGLFEPHVSNFAAVASVPAERRAPVLLRSPVAEEEADLQGLHEPDVLKLAGR
jgi:hypothetical protein